MFGDSQANEKSPAGVAAVEIRDSGTRFKELKRIEAAIEHRDGAELQWALGYCKMRLGIVPRKDHQKYWHKTEARVRRALENSK
jgi:hypothetical protein